MNGLFLIGFALVMGVISGAVFQRIKIPQVVGYILLGVLVGKSFLHLFETAFLQSLQPLVNYTLGLIGCLVGAELKWSVFKRYGRQIYAVLFAEGMGAFLCVAALVTWVTGKWSLGLILGAIASATDPASTINVLWEYKARGPVTRTVTAVIALDDALALILYALVSVFSKSLITHESFSWMEAVGRPVLEIIFGLALGVASGMVVIWLNRWIKEEGQFLTLILGVIGAGVGLSTFFHLDLILTSMAFGMTLSNSLPKVSEKVFNDIRALGLPLYIFFFVAVGARLDVAIFMKTAMLSLIIVYITGRSFGKVIGTSLAAWATHAPKTVQRYAGWALFTQAGVAIGLALSIQHQLSFVSQEAAAVGNLIVNVIAATTFIVQIAGPPIVKWAIERAGEAGRNITREDIIASMTVQDVMSENVLKIPADAHLKDILKMIKDFDGMNFVVVDREDRLHGIITLKELKDALFESELSDIILAEDIAVPCRFVVDPTQPLSVVMDYFRSRDVSFIPVVQSPHSDKIIGIVDRELMEREINRRFLEQHGSEE